MPRNGNYIELHQQLNANLIKVKRKQGLSFRCQDRTNNLRAGKWVEMNPRIDQITV
jgi:hypothetical protein